MTLYQILHKVEQSFMETIHMIQEAFKDDAMRAVQIKVWHKLQRWLGNC